MSVKIKASEVASALGAEQRGRYQLVRVFFRYAPGWVAVRNPDDTKMSVWLLHKQVWSHPDAFKRSDFRFLGYATQRDIEREGVNLSTMPHNF